MAINSTETTIPNVEVDEFGVPVISPEEMFDKLDEITDWRVNAKETAYLILNSIDAQIESLEKKKYKSVTPNEILAETVQRKEQLEKLSKQRYYWSSVWGVGVQRDLEYQKKEREKAAAVEYAKNADYAISGITYGVLTFLCVAGILVALIVILVSNH